MTADLLKRLGMKVDYAAIDWGTVIARLMQQSPPAQGGWNIEHAWLAGAACTNPAALVGGTGVVGLALALVAARVIMLVGSTYLLQRVIGSMAPTAKPVPHGTTLIWPVSE